MNRNIFLSLVSSIFLTTMCFGQDAPAMIDSNNNFLESNMTFYTKSPNHTELKGSPLLFEDAQEGYVKVRNGGRSESMKFNYDLIQDLIIVHDENKIYSIDKKYVDQLVITADPKKLSDTTVYQLFYTNDKTESNLYEVLVSGKYSLLKQIETKIVPANFNPTLQTGSKNPKVKKRKIYYTVNNGQLVKLAKKSKKIAKDKKIDPEFRKLVKSNKVNFKKEKEMIKFFKMINS